VLASINNELIQVVKNLDPLKIWLDVQFSTLANEKIRLRGKEPTLYISHVSQQILVIVMR